MSNQVAIKKVSFNVDEYEKEKIAALAKEEGKTLQEFIYTVVMRYVKHERARGRALKVLDTK